MSQSETKTIISDIFLLLLSWFKKKKKTTSLSFTQLHWFPAGISLTFATQFGLDTSVRQDFNRLTDLGFWWKFSHLQIDTFASCKSLTVTFPKGNPDSKCISSGIWGFHHKQGYKNQQKKNQYFIWQIFTKKTQHPVPVATIPQKLHCLSNLERLNKRKSSVFFVGN